MSTWERELDAMIPSFEFPGVYGWYTRFNAGWEESDWDFHDKDYEGEGLDVTCGSSSPLEKDAESVYRACEAMGGTGIVF